MASLLVPTPIALLLALPLAGCSFDTSGLGVTPGALPRSSDRALADQSRDQPSFDAASADVSGSDATVDTSLPDTTVDAPAPPVCGDGVTEPPETCDDNNTAGGDGCSKTCRTELFHGQLVAHWRMDESSGNTAADSASAAGKNDGELENMSSGAWIGGRLGNALLFEGNDDYVDVGPIGTYDDLSIAMWIRADAAPNGLNAIFHCDSWSSGDVHFILIDSGRIRFALNGNSATDRDSAGAITIGQKRWHHIAVVYRRSARTVDFYIDGKLDVQRTYSSTRTAVLGALQIGAWDKTRRNFVGAIDDLRFYGVAISAQAISYLASLP